MKVSALDSLPVAYVSHDSQVEKKVLLKYGEVPHVPQLAVATLKPGEQATMHHHKDMTESKGPPPRPNASLPVVAFAPR